MSEVSVKYDPLEGVPVGEIHIIWPSRAGIRLSVPVAQDLLVKLEEAMEDASKAERGEL